MIFVVNNLIDTIYKANKIIHIEGAIDKIIDIINVDIKYVDLVNICENIIKKNDLDKIRALFDEKIINFVNCYHEIIDEDFELKKLLMELQNNNL